jgi:hypothetical protein
MSGWDAWIQSGLASEGKFMTSYTICGTAGEVWASGGAAPCTAEEAKTLVNNLAGGNSQTQGLTYGGVKHMCLQDVGTAAIGKKGTSGVVVFQTSKARLIGHYNMDGATPKGLMMALERIAGAFENAGF